VESNGREKKREGRGGGGNVHSLHVYGSSLITAHSTGRRKQKEKGRGGENRYDNILFPISLALSASGKRRGKEKKGRNYDPQSVEEGGKAPWGFSPPVIGRGQERKGEVLARPI